SCLNPSLAGNSRSLGLRMRVAVHLRGPLQEAPQISALPPDKSPKLEEVNLLHLDAAVGFHAPEKIGTAPGRKTVPAGGTPEETEYVAHNRRLSINAECGMRPGGTGESVGGVGRPLTGDHLPLYRSYFLIKCRRSEERRVGKECRSCS